MVLNPLEKDKGMVEFAQPDHPLTPAEAKADADEDFTGMAQSQAKARKKNGGLFAKEADLEYIPDGGFYRYSTNPLIAGKEDKLGNWMISGSMKIVRAMTQKECDDLLTSHGMLPQEWEEQTGRHRGRAGRVRPQDRCADHLR